MSAAGNRWYSRLRTQQDRANASVWRWCGHLSYELIGPPIVRDLVDSGVDAIDGLSNVVRATTTILLWLSIVIAAPILFPLAALNRRRLARAQRHQA